MNFNLDDFRDKHLVSGFPRPKLLIVKQRSIELGEWRHTSERKIPYYIYPKDAVEYNDPTQMDLFD